MADISCVGLIVLDAIASTVEKLPAPGALQVFERLTLASGGCAMNTAAALGKLGTSVALFGKLGTDAFGDHVMAEARAAGVDTAGVRRVPDSPTSFTFVAVDRRGERSFTHLLGANATLSVEDVDLPRLCASRVVYYAGAFGLPKLDGAGAARLLREARRAGCLTAFDAISNPAVDAWALVRDALPHVDWLIPSEGEARLILRASGAPADGPPADLARRLLAAGARRVCIKLGEGGCLTVDPSTGAETTVPAYRVEKVVDTTGAGDSWSAGFLTGLVQGADPVEAMRLGNAVAAFCIQAPGAATGIRPLADVRAFQNLQRTG